MKNEMENYGRAMRDGAECGVNNMKTKVTIRITPEMGWVARYPWGSVAGSDETVSSLVETVVSMDWEVVLEHAPYTECAE